MPRLVRRLLSIAIVQSCVAFAAPTVARAETYCRAIDGGSPALAAIPAEQRLAWLNRRLTDDAARTRIWYWLWQSAYTGVTVVQLALLPTVDSTGEKAEKIVGASASAIGVISGFALPQKIMADETWWARHYRRSQGEHPCSLLNTLELVFIRDAESQAFGVGPLVHVGNFAINIAAGLILGLGYDRWQAFGYSTIVGIVVGEIQTITQPTDAIEDLRMYRRGELPPGKSTPRLGYALAPILRPDGGGAMFALTW